jgi:hypothetical protein
MQLDVRLNEDDTEVAIHFPDPSPGFTLLFTAVQLEEFIGVLLDVRERMQPPHALPGERPVDDDD